MRLIKAKVIKTLPKTDGWPICLSGGVAGRCAPVLPVLTGMCRKVDRHPRSGDRCHRDRQIVAAIGLIDAIAIDSIRLLTIAPSPHTIGGSPGDDLGDRLGIGKP